MIKLSKLEKLKEWKRQMRVVKKKEAVWFFSTQLDSGFFCISVPLSSCVCLAVIRNPFDFLISWIHGRDGIQLIISILQKTAMRGQSRMDSIFSLYFILCIHG